MAPLHQYAFETTRLRLRPLTTRDAAELSRIGSDADIAAVTRSIPFPFTVEDAITWIDQKQSDPDGFSFGIFRKDDDRLAGQIGLLQVEWENSQAELGFFIGREYWGNGYATEAASAIVDFGFDVVQFNRICAHHIAHNTASGAVLTKLGMKQEGVFRERMLKNGVFEDIVAYALLRSECR